MAFSMISPTFPISTPALMALIPFSSPSWDASIMFSCFSRSSSGISSPTSTLTAVSAMYPSICAPKSILTTSPDLIIFSSPAGDV